MIVEKSFLKLGGNPIKHNKGANMLLATVLDLSALVGNKPVLKSLTVWGLIIFTAAQAGAVEACTAGLLGTGVCATITTILKYVGGALTVLGLRRAATAPNTT
jgi:hypothetical protein